jgi:hypothetical protein
LLERLRYAFADPRHWPARADGALSQRRRRKLPVRRSRYRPRSIAIGDASDFAHAITFAATPSFDHAGRAWLVRLSRRGDAAGSVQIMRLRRQRDCNRYDVENRWEAPLRPGEYNAVAPRSRL